MYKTFINDMEKEFDTFIGYLQNYDEEGLGLYLAMAFDFKNTMLHTRGINLMNPSVVLSSNRLFTVELINMFQQLQMDQRLEDASTIMVWVFSFRAIDNHELLEHGKQMWKILLPGFPYILEQTKALEYITGRKYNVDQHPTVPLGLEPW